MTDLELKKLQKRQKIIFILMMSLIFLAAILFIKINNFVSIILTIAAIIGFLQEKLHKQMLEKLKKEDKWE